MRDWIDQQICEPFCRPGFGQAIVDGNFFEKEEDLAPVIQLDHIQFNRPLLVLSPIIHFQEQALPPLSRTIEGAPILHLFTDEVIQVLHVLLVAIAVVAPVILMVIVLVEWYDFHLDVSEEAVEDGAHHFLIKPQLIPMVLQLLILLHLVLSLASSAVLSHAIAKAVLAHEDGRCVNRTSVLLHIV